MGDACDDMRGPCARQSSAEARTVHSTTAPGGPFLSTGNSPIVSSPQCVVVVIAAYAQEEDQTKNRS